MAVYRIALTDMPDGSATSEPNGLLYEIVRRKYTLTFNAYCTSLRDTQIDVLSYVACPKVGDTFVAFASVDTLATCVDVKVKRASFNVWRITAEFDTDRIVSAVTDNPLLQPADIEYQTIEVEQPAIRDKFGQLVRNSAGEPFDPPVNEIVRMEKVIITQNLATFDKDQARDYTDSVNNATFQGQPRYNVKCTSRTGRRQFTRGLFYYQVSTTIEINPRTYFEYVLDQGYRDINKQLIRDPLDFSIPSNPTLLNGRGYPLRLATFNLPVAMAIGDAFMNHNDAEGVQWKFPPPVTISGGVLVPPHYYFYLRCEDEVMQVTGITLTQFLINRGTCGTTAAAHAIGKTVTMEPYFMFYATKDERDFSALSLPTF
jgi:hypothetical protein